MKRRILSTGGVGLLLIGFIIGYVVNSSMGHGLASAAGADTTSALIQTSPTTGSIDTAIERAYRSANKSVVFVSNPGTGTGSGVIYDTHGDIVTNAHVTAGGKAFKVTFSNGKTTAATLVGTDGADDLAVIHVNVTGLTPASFAAASSYRVAETVLAIGSPLGLEQTVTSGLISGLNRTEQEPTGAYIPDAIQTSAAINPGNSGGALVNLNGDVVGIPTIVQTATTGGESVQAVGFAIPSSRVTFIANQIVKYGKVTHTNRAFLGIVPGDSQVQPGFFGQSASSVAGAVVESLRTKGPAYDAGIRQGDVITKLDQTPISSADALLSSLANDKPGQQVDITVNRNGKAYTYSVTLGQLPG